MTEENKDNLTISIKKDSLWKYSTFILLAVIVVGAFVFFMGDKSATTGQIINNPGQQLPSEPSKVQASVDDDAVLGDKDAEVTIIEFSDYQCPFCGRFWSETLPLLKSQYIDTGKVKLVFRDFPLTSIHPNAQPAAEGAECVRDKGGDTAYWKIHDKIFENQASLNLEKIKAWAKELG